VLRNLGWTILMVLAGILASAWVGLILNFIVNHSAARYVWFGQGNMYSDLSAPYVSLRNWSLVMGATFGFIIAQVTYVLDRLQKQPSS